MSTVLSPTRLYLFSNTTIDSFCYHYKYQQSSPEGGILEQTGIPERTDIWGVGARQLILAEEFEEYVVSAKGTFRLSWFNWNRNTQADNLVIKQQYSGNDTHSRPSRKNTMLRPADSHLNTACISHCLQTPPEACTIWKSTGISTLHFTSEGRWPNKVSTIEEPCICLRHIGDMNAESYAYISVKTATMNWKNSRKHQFAAGKKGPFRCMQT